MTSVPGAANPGSSIPDTPAAPAAPVMRAAVIGAGYVGVVQAAGLSALGLRVRVGERDADRVRSLAAGRVPFYEPGLEELAAREVSGGRLTFHLSNQEAAAGADLVFITLPTPSDEAGAADISLVERAAAQLAPHMRPGSVLVLKSTVGLGATQRVGRAVAAAGSRAAVVCNPEFLREGNAVSDFFAPDRIVIGADDREAAQRVAGAYRGLAERGWEGRLLITDPASAELIKYAANAYLATRITFANSIANLCEAAGAEVDDVLAGMGSDRRIGEHYLAPGPGYGGSCFPKDTRGLAAAARRAGYRFRLLEEVMETNRLQTERMTAKVRAAAGGSLRGKKIGMWGLTFKADTDDVRESPAVRLAAALADEGAEVRAYDPRAGEVEGVVRAADPLRAAAGADVLLVATEWEEFREADLSLAGEAMAGSAVVDARNLLDREAVERAGLSYTGVGR